MIRFDPFLFIVVLSIILLNRDIISRASSYV